MPRQQPNQFPPEEQAICEGLINEIAQARTWEEVRTATRALLNVRMLAQQQRQMLVEAHNQQRQNQQANTGSYQPPPQPQPPQPPASRAPLTPAGFEIIGETATFEFPFDTDDEF